MTINPRILIDYVQQVSSLNPILLYGSPWETENADVDSIITVSLSCRDTAPTLALVWIDDVLAFELGGTPEFKPGFQGGSSKKVAWQSTGCAANNNLDVYIDKQTPLPSRSTVRVRYLVMDGLSWSTDGSFTFDTEDADAPVLERTWIEDQRTIALKFDEDIKTASATVTSGDGYVPGTPTVTVSGDTVLLTFADELSFASEYTVDYVVTDMSDEETDDEAVVSTDDYPVNVAARNVPEHWLNTDEHGFLLKLANLVSEVVGLAHKDVDYMLSIYDVNEMYDAHVSDMLASFGYDFLTGFVSDRKVLSLLFSIYKNKGVKEQMAGIIYTLVGIAPYIREWWTGKFVLDHDRLDHGVLAGGTPTDCLTFTLVFSRALTTDERRTVERVVEFIKPANTLCLIEEPTSKAGYFMLNHSKLNGSDVLA